MATIALARPAVRTGTAEWLLLLGPAALLVGALGFQFIGGLYPCELCMWQRWPHLAAIILAGAALAMPAARRPLLLAAALAVLTSAAIGVLHVGIEQHWWTGPTTCSSTAPTGGDFMAKMMAAPLIRCDAAAWSLFGISMAAFNALISTVIGLGGFRLLERGR